MRILLLAPFLPDRTAAHGGGTYLGTFCEGLSELAEVGIVGLSRPTDSQGAGVCFAYRALCPYLGDPGSPGHRRRMAWHWGVRGQPLVVGKHWQPALPGLLTRALQEFRPDAVLVEQAVMAQYLPWLQGVRTVLTDHEAGTPDQPCTGLGRLADRRDRRLWDTFVRRTYPLAGSVQALTSQDAARLRATLGRPVGLRRPVVPVAAEAVQPGASPPRALFLGDYRHHPNPEAAQVLVRELLPRLRAAVPDCELVLAGPNEQRIAHLRQPGVRIHGFAQDLPALLGSARCLLAPLYSGGGIRMKALTALAHGLPVVTNELGGRGADAPEPARIVAESCDALAAAAIGLLRDPDRAAAAGAAAHAWARANLSPTIVAREQLERLQRPAPSAADPATDDVSPAVAPIARQPG